MGQIYTCPNRPPIREPFRIHTRRVPPMAGVEDLDVLEECRTSLLLGAHVQRVLVRDPLHRLADHVHRPPVALLVLPAPHSRCPSSAASCGSLVPFLVLEDRQGAIKEVIPL